MNIFSLPDTNYAIAMSSVETSGVGTYAGTQFIAYAKTASNITMVLLLTGIIYALVRIWEIKNTERLRKQPAPKIAKMRFERDGEERWEIIREHLGSEGAEHWRLALEEADMLLDELVQKLGYLGANLPERLRVAGKGEFNTLESAWEAHKMRNKFVQTGHPGFELSQGEAYRIIGLYEDVFREFNFI